MLMNAEQENAKRFILTQTEIAAPAVQQKFSLSYTEITEVLRGLVEEEKIEFTSGVTYRVLPTLDLVESYIKNNGDKPYTQRSEDEKTAIRALWICLKSGSITVLTVLRRLQCGYTKASQAIEWMEKNGFVTGQPNRTAVITRDQFIKLFGDMDGEIGALESTKTELDKQHEEIFARLRKLSSEAEGSKDKDENDDNDDDDEEDDDDDDDEKEEIRFPPPPRDRVGTDEGIIDISAVNVTAVLAESIQYSVHEEGIDKFVLGMDGAPEFKFSFVRNGSALRMSDGGETLSRSVVSRRRIKNVVDKYAPVELSGEEICITVANPSGTLNALLMLYAAIDAVTRLR